MAILINGLEMPKENERLDIVINPNGKVTYSLDLNCKQIAIAHSPKVGHWVKDESGSLMCSKCGTLLDEFQKPSRFCPNCGAKMDLGEV